MQHVGNIDQTVAIMRARLDLISQRAQILDVRPNCRARDAQPGRKFGARDRVVPSLSHRGEDASVQRHWKSSAISTARAECVIAPTEIKSTPVSATARTFARFIPPLASVLALPPTIWTALVISNTA